MISYLNILIDICIIFAIWKTHKRRPRVTIKRPIIAKDLDKYYRVAKLAEKFAERAFSLASTANLGVVALQKSLQVPRIMNKNQANRNQLAKKQVDELFESGGGFEWLRPVLSDEENELIDQAIEYSEKQQMKEQETSQ